VGYSPEDIDALAAQGLVADHAEIMRLKAERRARKKAT
jgi:hypothetical protein